jgi:hypothetical protein
MMSKLKIAKLTCCVLLAAICTSLHAAERNILFVQQLKPGHLVFVSMNEEGPETKVKVSGLGATTVEKNSVIPTKKFSDLWDKINSAAFSSFKLSDDEEVNMADPGFYTISIGKGGGIDSSFQIPVQNTEGAVNDFVSEFKAIIE